MRRAILTAALLCGAALPAAAAVSISKGSTAVTASTTTCTPTMPAGINAGDLLFLVAESENQAITLSTANGFTEISSSPQSAGTAATSPASRLAVFSKTAAGGDTAPVVADSGDHTSCMVYLVQGGDPTTPINAQAGGNDSGANDTSAVIPGVTTTVDNAFIILITSTSNNATATTNCGAATNANLTGITEVTDSSNTAGLGGGHCLITGTMPTAGATGNTTLTLSATSFKGAITIAIAPNPPCSGFCWEFGSVPAASGVGSGATTTVVSGVTTGGASRIYVAAGSGTVGGRTVSSVSGGALTWNREVQQLNGNWTTEIWSADSAAALSSVSITVTWSGSCDSAAAVYSVRGAKTGTAHTRGSNGATGTSGVATTTVTTSWTGSFILASGESNDVTISAGTNTVVSYQVSQAGDHYWHLQFTGDTSSTGNYTTATSTTLSQWTIAAVEIVDASGTLGGGGGGGSQQSGMMGFWGLLDLRRGPESWRVWQ